MSRFGKDASLIIRSHEPFNAGPAPVVQRRARITPNELFFVRNHGNVPQLDANTFRLAVNGLVKKILSLSLDELIENFPKVELTATIQCAGNRRRERDALRAIEGEVPWDREAISTAKWGGVRLRHILLASGVQPAAHHVSFTSLDNLHLNLESNGNQAQSPKRIEHTSQTSFGGSIPISKALSPEVLLVYEMNDEPLPPVHGFPLRVVVPGYIGARCVKWLGEITLSEQPSANYFQANAYQLFPPEVRSHTAASFDGNSLGEQPVNAIICSPSDGETLFDEIIILEGYAIGGNGKLIEQVDVTLDDGVTWLAARVQANPNPWEWTFWEAHLRLPPGMHRIAVRAMDSSLKTQPPDVQDIWNYQGYLNHAWHRITVTVVDGA